MFEVVSMATITDLDIEGEPVLRQVSLKNRALLFTPNRVIYIKYSRIAASLYTIIVLGVFWFLSSRVSYLSAVVWAVVSLLSGYYLFIYRKRDEMRNMQTVETSWLANKSYDMIPYSDIIQVTVAYRNIYFETPAKLFDYNISETYLSSDSFNFLKDIPNLAGKVQFRKDVD
jgi:hypothetical protein